MTPLTLVKAHAYGNDFLLLEEQTARGTGDLGELAREVCERHRGAGADGLIVFSRTDAGASMHLFNADGSRSEISGNGLRCLAALLARLHGLARGDRIAVQTDAGVKRLELLDQQGARFTFRAAMGQPELLSLRRIHVNGADVEAITLRVGNPQCVVLGEATGDRLRAIAAPLAVHPEFPEGTNVELARVETPSRVRILIWERGVGPTEASGTGACAAAVAAMTYGGAEREIDVVSPGGTQRVAWLEDGLYLTGWAELIAEVRWLR